MKKGKRITSTFLVIVMTLSLLIGCGTTQITNPPAQEPAVAEIKYTPGTYESEVDGRNGKVKMAVTVDGKSIVSVEVLEHKETPGVTDGAIEIIPQSIVKEQSLQVDLVTGATITSAALLKGAEEALKQSGVDIALLKTKKAEKKELVQGQPEETDIVIVGAGMAGIMAAIELTQNHPDVDFILLEKLSMVAGSVARSGGVIFGLNSEFNQKQGKTVTSEEMFEYINGRSGGITNKDLFNRFMELSPETVATLDELGVTFKEEELYKGSLYMPKMYSIETNGGGGVMAVQLAQIVKNLGIDLRIQSPVVDLITEEGAVKGVKVEDTEKTYNIYADKIILATGGFTHDDELIEKYAPEFRNNVMQSSVGSTGDALRWLEPFNVKMVGESLMGSHRINPSMQGQSFDSKTTFIVNKDGKRFMNEIVPYFEKQILISKNSDSVAYGILDSNYQDMVKLEEGVKEGFVKKFNTLDEMAAEFGLNKDNLTATAKAYNEAYDANKDAEFGLPRENMISMGKAPYYGFTVMAVSIGSIPGPQVNNGVQVLDGSGKPIPNLYGAGEFIIGNIISNGYPGSGMGIGWAANSGRIAAIEAVKAMGK